jgi:HAD superfamily hydrolase (TIGR01484 family)
MYSSTLLKNTDFTESTMKNLTDFNSKIEFVLTDIDDTLTTEGQLGSKAYEALWTLQKAGIKVIPITGRPAGWCEMIARFWPVEGIVGENGGFYFRYAANKGEKNKKMQRWFFSNEETIKKNKQKLALIEAEVLKSVPGCAISSDQFCRLMDLAVDFCEDVPKLAPSEIQSIVSIFEQHGAHAKVSSIHVNGWFGDYNKLTTTFNFLKNEFDLREQDALNNCLFVGDSPNDEPMFEKFPHSFGVANVLNFQNQMKTLPAYISDLPGGEGFAEIAEKIIQNNSRL